MTTEPPSPPGESKPFRLAFRQEGPSVNAYLAPLETMQGAILFSSMPLAVLAADALLWADWKDLMKRAVEVVVRETLGVGVLRYEEQNAPEHERAGNA